jgi:tryptophan synthase alpha chain
MRSPSELERRLRACRDARRAGLVPFFTAGHPWLDATGPLLAAAERAGAAAVEVGVPFTDPLADGPAIQASSQAALEAGSTLATTVAAVRRFRSTSALPVVLMSYANPVLTFGPGRFAEALRDAGVSGVVLTDLPPEERPDVWEALERAGCDAVFLVAPTTGPTRRQALAERARGFVYCVSRTGVTGEGAGFSPELASTVAAVRAATSVPVGVGFGIKDETMARAAAGLADAVIVGAALCERLEALRGESHERVLGEAEELVRRLARAVAGVVKPAVDAPAGPGAADSARRASAVGR